MPHFVFRNRNSKDVSHYDYLSGGPGFRARFLVWRQRSHLVFQKKTSKDLTAFFEWYCRIISGLPQEALEDLESQPCASNAKPTFLQACICTPKKGRVGLTDSANQALQIVQKEIRGWRGRADFDAYSMKPVQACTRFWSLRKGGNINRRMQDSIRLSLFTCDSAVVI